jgi:undecaprenyl-diphosphatase
VLGGVWMLGAEWFAARRPERSTITWTVAILVGLAQVVAGVFPGTSRSAATIFVAMLAGTGNRAAATEFAFLVGIPTMFAASGYELLKTLKGGGAAHEDWAALAIAFIVSAVTAFVAVRWLLGYIRTRRFTPFAIYRIVLGLALLFMA